MKNTCLHILSFGLISLLFLGSGAVAQNSASSMDAVISQLQLDETETPMSEHPNWNPSKILIMERGPVSAADQELRSQLEDIAGDVELVFSSAGVLDESTLAGVDAVLGVCSPQLLASGDEDLLWVHNYFVGIEGCSDVPMEDIEGRYITNSQKLSSPSIAEHVVTLMMSLSRNFPAIHDAQRERNWDRSIAQQLTFGELSEKTILIAGLGGIGTEVAKRAHGLGMRVIATRNSSRTGPDYVDYVGLSHELNELAMQADIVVNALPLTDQTTGIFNQEFFQAIKPNSIFVSVGRGKSTITNDLIEAIESGKLYGAGLDVTDPEPLPASSPLWNLDNVIITPHMATAGGLSIERSKLIVLENLRRYVEGERLLSPVDLSEGY